MFINYVIFHIYVSNLRINLTVLLELVVIDRFNDLDLFRDALIKLKKAGIIL